MRRLPLSPATWALALTLALSACSDRTDDEIRGQVTLALNHEGAPAAAAVDRLVKHGRRAIPTIESALHTASPGGKKTLIKALRRIADVESVPLLRHFAMFDPNPDVRREAEGTLRAWTEAGGELADQARAAVRTIEEHTGAEEAG